MSLEIVRSFLFVTLVSGPCPYTNRSSPFSYFGPRPLVHPYLHPCDLYFHLVNRPRHRLFRTSGTRTLKFTLPSIKSKLSSSWVISKSLTDFSRFFWSTNHLFFFVLDNRIYGPSLYRWLLHREGRDFKILRYWGTSFPCFLHFKVTGDLGRKFRGCGRRMWRMCILCYIFIILY